MCGRFVYAATLEDLIAQFGLDVAAQDTSAAVAPRYNIAPAAQVPVIRQSPQGARVAHLLRWGLVPNWAKSPDIGSKLNNARAESVAQKPSFRAAYRQRRCLIPANGFYEWQEVAGEKKQPWFIRLKSGELMAMGGLWESWINPAGDIERTFCVVTTAANALMQPIHERMPVIVPRERWAAWLDPRSSDADAMLVPFDAAAMEAWPVSLRVSRASEEGAELISSLS
jgi:putative SOS response-associated peptidase YedK